MQTITKLASNNKTSVIIMVMKYNKKNSSQDIFLPKILNDLKH